MSHFASDQNCDCNLPGKVLTAWTPKNPARRFVVCRNRYSPGKKCAFWDWYDPELEDDWYRYHMYEMYNLLNPNQRRELENEMSRQVRLEQLQVELAENGAELRRCLASLTFWKSTFLAFAIVVSLVLAMK